MKTYRSNMSLSKCFNLIANNGYILYLNSLHRGRSGKTCKLIAIKLLTFYFLFYKAEINDIFILKLYIIAPSIYSGQPSTHTFFGLSGRPSIKAYMYLEINCKNSVWNRNPF